MRDTAYPKSDSDVFWVMYPNLESVRRGDIVRTYGQETESPFDACIVLKVTDEEVTLARPHPCVTGAYPSKQAFTATEVYSVPVEWMLTRFEVHLRGDTMFAQVDNRSDDMGEASQRSLYRWEAKAS